MITLAIECSSPRGSVAVARDEEVIFSESFECPRGRGAELFPVLERAVGAAGSRVDRVISGTGPGAYNGLRVSAAAAEGLALAHGARRCGVVSVLGVDGGERFCYVLDARGGTLALACVEHGVVRDPIQVIPKSDALEWLAREWSGAVICPSPISGLADARIAFPEAARLLPFAGSEDELIRPYYAKPVCITQPKRGAF